MKILLDENIPWPLSRFLSGHEVTSVQRELIPRLLESLENLQPGSYVILTF